MHRSLLHVFVGLVMGSLIPNSLLVAAPPAGKTLPKSEPLTISEPLDEVMVAGIDRFALRALAESVEQRKKHWNRDYSSREAYENSIAANRKRFQTIIGAVDPRVEGTDIELVSTITQDSLIARFDRFTVHAARWQVLAGVTAEGLLLRPIGKPQAYVVALPDADWTPEMFTGLVEGVTAQAQLPRRLAENGVMVLVPTLISRDDTYSGNDLASYTNQAHREFVYRMAFEMGRHVIGYEVQKVSAAVDQFQKLIAASGQKSQIGVVGVGEGGLLALYAAAADPRIDTALVSGYFSQREQAWQEPIYRNVWSLLTQFGDAEIASLIAPRRLVIEACWAPEVEGPHKAKPGRRAGAAPGFIKTPELQAVKSEYGRAAAHFKQLNVADQFSLAVSEAGIGPAGSQSAVENLLAGLKISAASTADKAAPQDINLKIDADQRQKRQVEELVTFTQTLLRLSAKKRDDLWSKADRSSVDAWVKTAQQYRDLVYDEMIGRLPKSTMPLHPRSRLIIDEPEYRGYEVVLDVYPDVIASGILLIPADLKDGERRPVVVCQHGLEGTPMSTIETAEANERSYAAYKSFSVQLVKRGFVVYAPQNPYRGYDRFRTLQRKSNLMKRSLYSYIIPQHERTLEWLSTLPYVDPARIGFYGLSYGGKTAVRVPPFVEQYALSICSADFSEWVKKNTSNENRYSYIFTGEYEIFEWNMGHYANYAELSTLMTPRPFMVERGHNDGVGPDEWVAWEYAKVRRHYDKLGLGERTEIEFFNGPHTINGQGTFEFLHRHLNWPKPNKG